MEPVSDQSATAEREMTVAQHKDRFRGQCAIVLDWNAKITTSLANAIRISPMNGCTDLGAIDVVREHMEKMGAWLDKAECSARAVQEGERAASDERHGG